MQAPAALAPAVGHQRINDGLLRRGRRAFGLRQHTDLPNDGHTWA